METKKSKKDPTKPARNAIPVEMQPGGDLDAAFASAMLRPTVQAARTLYQSQGDQHTVEALTKELAAQVQASLDGENERSESMLISQAHTLDELFHVLTRRALLNFGGQYLDAGERYMRLALKAQSQARTTLETLASIKNPPIYARQANIAHGPQQINNSAEASSHARKNESAQTQLSGSDYELLQDSRAPGYAGRTNSTLEALGEIDWAKIPRR